jgi:hypothetical protein
MSADLFHNVSSSVGRTLSGRTLDTGRPSRIHLNETRCCWFHFDVERRNVSGLVVAKWKMEEHCEDPALCQSFEIISSVVTSRWSFGGRGIKRGAVVIIEEEARSLGHKGKGKCSVDRLVLCERDGLLNFDFCDCKANVDP